MKSLHDATWKDALLIELASMTERVKSDMWIAPISTIRITGLVEEYEKERMAKREAPATVRDAGEGR